MGIELLLKKKGITKYRLARESGIPNATLSDICSGKANILKCSVETIYKICKVLGVNLEDVIEDEMVKKERERSFEYGLPLYLQNDLDAYKEGLKNKSTLLDCLWGELYGSINMAEINDNVISHEHAEYLRKKYLWS